MTNNKISKLKNIIHLYTNTENMTNNKQQTAVEQFAERTFNLIELMKRKWVNQEEFLDGMLKARNEAKEMQKQTMIEFAQSYAVIHCMGDITKNAEQYYKETYENEQ
jgi:hypothetical protein